MRPQRADIVQPIGPWPMRVQGPATVKLRELLESRALTQAHEGHLELSTQFSGLQREITCWADDPGERQPGDVCGLTQVS